MATKPELFLIGALPRSGSCWISTVLNLSSQSRCLHEGPAYYADPIKEVMEARVRYSGDCGSHVMIGRYKYLPARRVFILRSKDQVKRSTKAFFERCNGESLYKDELIDSLYEQALTWIREFGPLVVPYNELFTLEAVEKIWKHCLPGCEFPEAKVKQLLSVNIQIKDFDIMARRHELLEVSERLQLT